MARDGWRTLSVSPEVWHRLTELASPGDTPDTVLRMVLRLPPREQGRRSSVLKPVEEGSP